MVYYKKNEGIRLVEERDVKKTLLKRTRDKTLEARSWSSRAYQRYIASNLVDTGIAGLQGGLFAPGFRNESLMCQWLVVAGHGVTSY